MLSKSYYLRSITVESFHPMQLHGVCHAHGELVRTCNHLSKREDPPFWSRPEKRPPRFQGMTWIADSHMTFSFFMSLNIMDHTIPLHQFRLKDGVRKVPHYGLLLAKVAGLPSSVIDTATSITSRITEQVNLSVLIRADVDNTVCDCLDYIMQLKLYVHFLLLGSFSFLTAQPCSFLLLDLISSTRAHWSSQVYLFWSRPAGNGEEGRQLRAVPVAPDGVPGHATAHLLEAIQPRRWLHPGSVAESQGRLCCRPLDMRKKKM